MNARKALHGTLLVASIGLALHLVFPQIPRIERSLRLISDTSHLLVGTAFVAEVLSELCYAELLGRSVEMVSGPGYSSRLKRRRGIERWFMLRLTVTSYGVQHVLPAGGAVATTMTFRLLRRRGLDPEKVALALGGLSVLVYGVLGILFAYVAYRRPTLAERVAKAGISLIGRLPRGSRSRSVLETAEVRSAEFVSQLAEEFRTAHRRLTGSPKEVLELSALALGYWAFDALCLILMFEAMGVPASPFVLIAAYGVATVIAMMPLTPGGIGVFEVTMFAIVALLGVGSEAIIPILGYRLFNFWLPIPLAAIFYPTLRLGAGRATRQA